MSGAEPRNKSQKACDPVDAHVGARLRARRIEVGITQIALGEHLGVTFQQIKKYEKGVNRIAAGRLHRAAELLGVPVAHFYEGFTPIAQGPDEDSTPHLSQVYAALADPMTVRLVLGFTRLPLTARRAVLDIVRELERGMA
ncbi:MAG TPA: helix-turn-helix transcriptional regulator [Salinarimonas sp.]|nr:helix-turn-helix transcriptional regulator [Salinarimonas sp.]